MIAPLIGIVWQMNVANKIALSQFESLRAHQKSPVIRNELQDFSFFLAVLRVNCGVNYFAPKVDPYF